MKIKPLFITTILLTLSITACTSTKGYTNPNNQNTNNREKQKTRPTADQLIKQMDSNGDNKLSKNEIKGPLINIFSEIDINNDNFITKEELQNAPKPPRGKRQQTNRL